MRIMTIVGARPQFIKAATVSRLIEKQSGCDEILVHTGQHYDPQMSDVFFDELCIPRPDHYLGVGSGSHGVQTGRMLSEIESLLLSDRPDQVLIYGDTNSTLAGALAATKLHIPVAHVEAGLRSFNRRMPEEINRIMADHVSELLFIPNETARENLEREGIESSRICFSGDVMFDAHLFYREQAANRSRILEELELESEAFGLATIHRAENTDDPVRMARIIDGLNALASELPIVWPIHPRTRKVLDESTDRSGFSDQLKLVDPVGYLDMIQLEVHSRIIATDSGGVQKEAFFAGVPCVTLRDETEWIELVEMGWNQLAPPGGTTPPGETLLDALKHLNRPRLSGSPYGDGTAAEVILERLIAEPD